MKMLKDHQILFDAECPMCKLYTKAIVNAGILDGDGRIAYQEVTEQACPMVDWQRAVNEIALINHQTGEVTYGIESLFKVMSAVVPGLHFLFSFKPFVWLMAKVYAFISYNRRVIIPPHTNSDHFQLQPTFRLYYRIAYIVFTWFVVGFILSAYAPLLTGVIPEGESYREYIICGGQILFQGLVILVVNKEKIWSYLGNMMTISLAGGLLLLPVIWMSNWLTIDPLICTIWFIIVAGLMLLEHIRRCRLLEVGWVLSAGWVAYRLLILVVLYLRIL
ncbi:DCC1-like thiol-disulfide oxidoreductase family protein [Dyadobacter sp. CY312]|uniref:DCC1-like thiol-disulfide oxidoreductase family protein n=1 Tax=Dyadobacter sp. CY312 TaxID=2907303 RepID=UPI001F2EC45C|nr:DCC1-like thiol-disulfide oxidoreductase family protein [Dyadobacter sp. CY312]MCE7041885.1 DCC1-like thiol-disulfide oxidoreductase family protein [Dyadobacter sp. CY312]